MQAPSFYLPLVVVAFPWINGRNYGAPIFAQFRTPEERKCYLVGLAASIKVAQLNAQNPPPQAGAVAPPAVSGYWVQFAENGQIVKGGTLQDMIGQVDPPWVYGGSGVPMAPLSA